MLDCLPNSLFTVSANPDFAVKIDVSVSPPVEGIPVGLSILVDGTYCIFVDESTNTVALIKSENGSFGATTLHL